MPLYKTEGIIIFKRDFRENDRIFLIYTKEEGLLSLLAKGTRKKESKLKGSLLPFSWVEIIYAKGKAFDQITAVTVIKNFQNIRQSYHVMIWLNLLAEIIISHLKPKYREPGTFELFKKLLSLFDLGLKDKEKMAPLLSLAATHQLLVLLGFKPELYACLKCQKKLQPVNNYFSPRQGGLVCPSCRAEGDHCQKISDQAIKAIRFFQERDLSEVGRFRLPPSVFQEVKIISFDYLEYILEEPLKTIEFIKQTT